MSNQRENPTTQLGIRTRTIAGALCSAVAMLAVFAMMGTAHAQTYHVIHNFAGGLDGAEPTSGLTMDAQGNFYGTTFEGDAGTGTLYKLAHASIGWTLVPLFYFGVENNGVIPYDRPVFGPDGSLYATTAFGGVGPCMAYGMTGCGTVFKLKAGQLRFGPWNETVLYRFTGGSDGANPYGGDLIFDSAGNMYGTADNGGSTNCFGGCGIVFKLTHSGNSWTQSVLYTFTNGTDGAHPYGGLVFDSAGNLYGTTTNGGAFGHGAVFELTNSGSGWTQTTLYSFQGPPDGGHPYAGLIFDAQGNLYGATTDGGPNSGGTVFRLNQSGGHWTFTLLYPFIGPPGVIYPGPIANLAFDRQGNLWGTTHVDGDHDHGSVFKLTPAQGLWTYSDIYSFTGGTDGGYPRSNIVFDGTGNMYGTASSGGAVNCGQASCGVVFEITP